MSMLGNSFLNEITNEPKGVLKSGEILDDLRDKITGALAQSGKKSEAHDGMDIALCVYNRKKMILQYSGAYNPLYLIRGQEFLEYKADRMPIGTFPEKKKFTTNTIKLHKNDVLYLFSDGFPDQFGGPMGKKFTAKRFKDIIIEKAAEPISNLDEYLQKQLDDWQTESEQIDDILVIGLRI
jgi:serine phosphatase RsbU (regulator of sigma subunit)